MAIQSKKLLSAPCYILAGGQSRRMHNSDHKSLLSLGGGTIIERLIHQLKRQTSGEIILNTFDAEAFRSLGLRVIQDVAMGAHTKSDKNAETGESVKIDENVKKSEVITQSMCQGPLHGLYSAMLDSAKYAREYFITTSSDTPFIPNDMVSKLLEAASQSSSQCAIVSSSGRIHPIIGCWNSSQASELHACLAQGNRRALSWVDKSGAEIVNFENIALKNVEIDPFFNINTRAELTLAQHWDHIVYRS